MRVKEMEHPEDEPREGDDCRCSCGNLLAKLVEGRVEVKCRRCRRLVLLSWEDAEPTDLARAEEDPSRAPTRSMRVPNLTAG